MGMFTLGMMFLLGAGDAGTAITAERMVECDGERVTEIHSSRALVGQKTQTAFHAVFRFTDGEAETISSSDSDVPLKYIGGRTTTGDWWYLAKGADWQLTLFKGTGRFELKSLRLESSRVGLLTTTDTATGSCKAFQKSDVFD